MNKIMKASSACINAVKHFEELKLIAYLCPANRWTVGYGHTQGVKKGLKVTEPEALTILLGDVCDYEDAVNKMLKIQVNQGQFDALICFAFNAGISALSTSTLMKKLNAGDLLGAAKEFPRWNKADGSHNGKDDDNDGLIDEVGEKQELAGITRRRNTEKALFEGHNLDEALAIGWKSIGK